MLRLPCRAQPPMGTPRIEVGDVLVQDALQMPLVGTKRISSPAARLPHVLPPLPDSPFLEKTHRSRDWWSAPTRVESSRCPWSEACIIGTHARRRKIASPTCGCPATRKSPVGRSTRFLGLPPPCVYGSTVGVPRSQGPTILTNDRLPVLRIPRWVKRRAHHDKVAPAAARARHDARALDHPASWSPSRSARSDHEELAPEARQDVVAGLGH